MLKGLGETAATYELDNMNDGSDWQVSSCFVSFLVDDDDEVARGGRWSMLCGFRKRVELM